MKFDKRMHYAIGLVAICLLFIIIMLKLGLFFPRLDFAFSRFAKSIQSGFGILLMRGVSALASFWFLSALSVLVTALLYRAKKSKEIMFYYSTLILGVLLGVLIKFIVARVRPNNPFEVGFSFPSGHVVASVLAFGAIAYFLWEEHKHIAQFLLVIPILVGISRIYLNVHWFSDVVAGFALALIWLYFCMYVFYKTK